MHLRFLRRNYHILLLLKEERRKRNCFCSGKRLALFSSSSLSSLQLKDFQPNAGILAACCTVRIVKRRSLSPAKRMEQRGDTTCSTDIIKKERGDAPGQKVSSIRRNACSFTATGASLSQQQRRLSFSFGVTSFQVSGFLLHSSSHRFFSSTPTEHTAFSTTTKTDSQAKDEQNSPNRPIKAAVFAFRLERKSQEPRSEEDATTTITATSGRSEGSNRRFRQRQERKTSINIDDPPSSTPTTSNSSAGIELTVHAFHNGRTEKFFGASLEAVRLQLLDFVRAPSAIDWTFVLLAEDETLLYQLRSILFIPRERLLTCSVSRLVQHSAHANGGSYNGNGSSKRKGSSPNNHRSRRGKQTKEAEDEQRRKKSMDGAGAAGVVDADVIRIPEDLEACQKTIMKALMGPTFTRGQFNNNNNDNMQNSVSNTVFCDEVLRAVLKMKKIMLRLPSKLPTSDSIVPAATNDRQLRDRDSKEKVARLHDRAIKWMNTIYKNPERLQREKDYTTRFLLRPCVVQCTGKGVNSYGRLDNPLIEENYPATWSCLTPDEKFEEGEVLYPKATTAGDTNDDPRKDPFQLALDANCTIIVTDNGKHCLHFFWRSPSCRNFFRRGGRVWCCELAEYLLSGTVCRNISVEQFDRSAILSQYKEREQGGNTTGGSNSNFLLMAVPTTGSSFFSSPSDSQTLGELVTQLPAAFPFSLLQCEKEDKEHHISTGGISISDISDTCSIGDLLRAKKKEELYETATIFAHQVNRALCQSQAISIGQRMEALLASVEMEHNGLYWGADRKISEATVLDLKRQAQTLGRALSQKAPVVNTYRNHQTATVWDWNQHAIASFYFFGQPASLFPENAMEKKEPQDPTAMVELVALRSKTSSSIDLLDPVFRRRYVGPYCKHHGLTQADPARTDLWKLIGFRLGGFQRTVVRKKTYNNNNNNNRNWSLGDHQSDSVASQYEVVFVCCDAASDSSLKAVSMLHLPTREEGTNIQPHVFSYRMSKGVDHINTLPRFLSTVCAAGNRKIILVYSDPTEYFALRYSSVLNEREGEVAGVGGINTGNFSLSSSSRRYTNTPHSTMKDRSSLPSVLLLDHILWASGPSLLSFLDTCRVPSFEEDFQDMLEDQRQATSKNIAQRIRAFYKKIISKIDASVDIFSKNGANGEGSKGTSSVISASPHLKVLVALGEQIWRDIQLQQASSSPSYSLCEPFTPAVYRYFPPEEIRQQFSSVALTPGGGGGEGMSTLDNSVLQRFAERGEPVAPLLIEYRAVQKLINTYFDLNSGAVSFVYPQDSCFHGEFAHCRTATTRLSARAPNLQNFPKEETFRKFLHSRFGKKEGKMIEIDYSQLEVGVLSLLSQDRNMIDGLARKVDFHCKRVTMMHPEIPYEEVVYRAKVLKENRFVQLRSTAKVFSFQRQYGAGVRQLSQTTGLPLWVVSKLIEEEKNHFPDVEGFFEFVRHCISHNPISPKHHHHPVVPLFPLLTGTRFAFVEREQLLHKGGGGSGDGVPEVSHTIIRNYPVQGFAAEMVQVMVGRLFRHFLHNNNYNQKAYIVNTVHDSVWVDAHVSVAVQVAADSQAILQDVESTFKRLWPEMPMNVKFPADVMLGSSMIDMKGAGEPLPKPAFKPFSLE